MKFSPIQIESVLSIYQDESQDPNYIKEKTGIKIEDVIKILDELKSNGEIIDTEDILIDKLESIYEGIRGEDIDLSDQRYFFTIKRVNYINDFGSFRINIKEIISIEKVDLWEELNRSEYKPCVFLWGDFIFEKKFII